MLFDMLAKRTYGTFLSPNSRFQFFIELDKTIPLTAMEGIEHGSGQIRNSVKCELYFMLKVCVFRALVRHTYPAEEELRCLEKPFCWPDYTSVLKPSPTMPTGPGAKCRSTRTAAEHLFRVETLAGWRVLIEIFRGRLSLPSGADCGETPPFAVDELLPLGDPYQRALKKTRQRLRTA
jgi:hypothetical protein